MTYFELGVMECPYPLQDLKGKSRVPELVRWRHVLLYLLKKQGATFQKAGEMLNRDHTTALHAFKKVENAIDGYDKKLLEVLHKVTKGDRVSVHTNHNVPSDIYQSELIGLVNLENKLNKK